MSEEAPTQKPIETIPSEPKERTRSMEDMLNDPRYEAWMADHPVPEIVQESAEACAEKIKEFEGLVADFEQTHDLEALTRVTEFASLEERRSSFRQLAVEALVPIYKLLDHLKTQNAVSRETFRALQIRYRILDRAVGTGIQDVTGKKFDIIIHNRPI